MPKILDFKYIKLVSHWHGNFSRLFCEFCCGLSHDVRASVMRIFMCRELVANWSRRFKTCLKILCEFFRQNILQDCRAMVAGCSCKCRKPVDAKFWRIYNAKFSRLSYECCASVARWPRNSLEKTCENLVTIWRKNKTK